MKVESGKVKGSEVGVQGAGAGKTGERFNGKSLTSCFTDSVYFFLRFGVNIPITNPEGSYYGRGDCGVSRKKLVRKDISL